MASKLVVPAAKKEEEKLPKAEQEMFKQLIDLFERKQYKKGIKTADQILKKSPNHGETLAMKGLIVNGLGRREEAFELVKLGIKNDMKSHLCWHVYGLIFKADSNYPQAIKSYLQALKIDPSNFNILRDLSFLQLQVRDFSGFLQSRTKILETKGSIRSSWVAFAAATYLACDYKRSFDMISRCEEPIFGDSMELEAINELAIFQSKCLEKEGKYNEVLAHFRNNDDKIRDKLYIRRKTAELLVMLGRFEEAEEAWIKLLHEQSDNYCFHRGLQCAFLKLGKATNLTMLNLRNLDLPCTVLSLPAEKKSELYEFYKKIGLKSRAVPKISLFLLEGEEFTNELREYLKKQIQREIPSLYQDICALVRAPVAGTTDRSVPTKEFFEFRNHSTTKLAISLVKEMISNLRSTGTFTGTNEKEKESPSALLWALYLQSHLLEASGLLDEALLVIEEAQMHTPTALDILLQKARVLKQMGQFQLAAKVANECRLLDLQDRFLNNKTTKYMFRTDQISAAKKTIHLFVKDELDPDEHLIDMQVNWFLTELAESYSRKSMYGESLRTFNHVKKHFNDYVEDIYDFHQYVFKKCTLTSFTDTLDFHEVQNANKFFQRAFLGATSILLKFVENPEILTSAQAAAADSASAAANVVTVVKENEKDKSYDKEKDEEKDKSHSDPFGVKLLARNPKDELTSWCGAISSSLSRCNTEVITRYASVMIYTGKFVQALRAISIAMAKSPLSEVVIPLISLAQLLNGSVPLSALQNKSTSEPVVKQVLDEEVGRLLSGKSITDFVDTFAESAKAQNSLTLRVVAARCLSMVGKAAEATSIITDDSQRMWGETARNLKFADVLSCLSSVRHEFPTAINSFMTQIRLRYPRADLLLEPYELEESWQDGRLLAVNGETLGNVSDALPSSSSSNINDEEWELVEKDAAEADGLTSSSAAGGGRGA